jgi:four helix bundle protein
MILEFSVNENDLKKRTRQFDLKVIYLVESLPSGQTARTIGNQLLRSGMSVGANYRAACRGRSKADFIAKAGISLEEADEYECLYWMELLQEANIIPIETERPHEGSRRTCRNLYRFRQNRQGPPQSKIGILKSINNPQSKL